MTMSTTASSVTYQGNGTTTVFPFAFQVSQISDLQIIVTDNSVSPSAITPLQLSQYTVVGIGNSGGGSITYPLSGAPLPINTALTVQRVVAYVQDTSIVNQGGFYPDVIEGALDHLTAQTQQLADGLSRAVQVPVGGTLAPSSYLATIETSTKAASTSAGAAATSATGAAASANSAQILANAAAASASTATTEANIATTAANNAATSANTAAAEAGMATSAASTATTSANAAAGSANTANIQAGNAQTSAINAANSANAAASSANAAAGSVSAVGTSASAAVASANAAAASATSAAGSASSSAVSATNAAASAAAMSASSSTAQAIATGSMVFVTQAGKYLIPGTWVIISSTAGPTNFMHGQVIAYSGTALNVNVTDMGGTGTHSDWVISVSGTQGPQGAQGIQGGQGLQGPSGPGSGNVSGPASSTSGNFSSFSSGTGTAIQDSGKSAASFLQAANNLADLASPATARANMGAGTVTSVALAMPGDFTINGGPVTGSGTLTVSRVNQSPNAILAGPSSGGAGAPSWRSLVVADLPVGTPSATDLAAIQQDMVELYLKETIDTGSAAGSYVNGGFDAFNSDTLSGVSGTTGQTYDGTNHLYAPSLGIETSLLVNSSSNYSAHYVISAGSNSDGLGISQAVVLAASDLITKVSFYLYKVGSPSGNATVALYASVGAPGSSGKPTGSALASATLDVSTLPSGIGAISLVQSIFGTPYAAAGGNYCVLLTYSGGDNSNFVGVGASSPSTDPGNMALYNGSIWTASPSVDVVYTLTGKAYNNMTLITAALSPAPATAPIQAQIDLLWKDLSGTAVLGTDLTTEVTSNAGTTWSSAIPVDSGITVSGFRLLKSVISLSGSGTAVQVRTKFLNNKQMQAKGLGIMLK